MLDVLFKRRNKIIELIFYTCLLVVFLSERHIQEQSPFIWGGVVTRFSQRYVSQEINPYYVHLVRFCCKFEKIVGSNWSFVY
jgi:hypothetical protein